MNCKFLGLSSSVYSGDPFPRPGIELAQEHLSLGVGRGRGLIQKQATPGIHSFELILLLLLLILLGCPVSSESQR